MYVGIVDKFNLAKFICLVSLTIVLYGAKIQLHSIEIHFTETL